MKIGFDEGTKFFRLMDLQRKLRALDYNVLQLKYLDLLRMEVDAKLKEFHEKHKGETF